MLRTVLKQVSCSPLWIFRCHAAQLKFSVVLLPQAVASCSRLTWLQVYDDAYIHPGLFCSNNTDIDYMMWVRHFTARCNAAS